MQGNNIYIPHKTITTTTSGPLPPSFLTLLLSSPNMSTNYLAQSHPSQVWSWETAMDPLHHHHTHHHHHHLGGGSEMEHMFEKPLTPSDVGKLNRLVIPKQHAEKYFPMAGGESGEKGLLLNFEDESGKAWRFRYSYWTSSQSYVLTKGWSRFVKEKQLDAGDVVLFQRRRGDSSLYIGCRRRGDATQSGEPAVLPWSPVFYATSASPSSYYINPMQQDSHHHAGTQSTSESTSATTAKPGNSKRLRLFGVNLDCGPEI